MSIKKLRLYKTLILPAAAVCLDTQQDLEDFERNMLRIIFWPVKEQGCWQQVVMLLKKKKFTIMQSKLTIMQKIPQDVQLILSIIPDT